MSEWHEYEPKAPFGQLIGPIERLVDDNGTHYRVQIREQHRNEAGILHGGAIAAIVDEIVGTMVKESHGREHVTVQLTTTFLASVEVGAYIRPTCDIVRTTRSMIFVESKLLVDDAAVASATLIYKLRSGPRRP